MNAHSAIHQFQQKKTDQTLRGGEDKEDCSLPHRRLDVGMFLGEVDVRDEESSSQTNDESVREESGTRGDLDSVMLPKLQHIALD